VEIRLLGQARVHRDDGTVVEPVAWRTGKTFDMVRVLALAGDRPVPVEVLVDLLWPTADPARGATSLRTAACQVRKVLGRDSLERVGNALALRGAWVDTRAYQELATRVADARERECPAALVQLVREAEALYEGDVDVAGTDCTALHQARSELRRLRGQLLVEAAEATGACGAWRESLELAQRADASEISDRSTRALMRAWFALGETARPVEDFERLRRHLANAYGVDPAPQTRALYLRIVSDCAEWPLRETTIGREDEVRRLTSAVIGWLMDPDAVGGVVWLVGEPGSGRETVARETARTLMLPLAQTPAEAAPDHTLELLRDQGTPTRELAATLRDRAQMLGRVLIVPVSEMPEGMRSACDAVVPVPPLDRASFRRLLTVALQGRPTPRLEEELYSESRGLPGVACARARLRLHEGSLSWAPEGVDTVQERARPRPALLKVRTALAAVPLAWLALLGGEGLEPTKLRAVEETAPSSVALDRGRLVARRHRRRGRDSCRASGTALAVPA
jgi:DNA-binding SARP family transcriptional activator